MSKVTLKGVRFTAPVGASKAELNRGWQWCLRLENDVHILLTSWRKRLTGCNTFVIISSNGRRQAMLKTSVRRVGNSLGITLPKTIVDNYHLTEGDELHLVETEEGVVLTPFNPKFAEWAKAYERTNRKYKDVLKALAK
jgi:antitoxin MazE